MDICLCDGRLHVGNLKEVIELLEVTPGNLEEVMELLEVIPSNY